MGRASGISTLRSDRRALIPRPETEGLVELVLARVRGWACGRRRDRERLHRAQPRHRGQLTIGWSAIDLSADALRLADENRRLTAGRSSCVRGDLGASLRPGSLDALVSNPPYLTDSEYATLDTSVRDWEPATALVSGADGLQAIARLLDAGEAVVRPGGWLALEVDSARAALCARRAGALGLDDVADSCRPFRPRAISARAQERCDVIWDKAQELGRLIGQSAEYQALRRAETTLREDKDTVAKLDQIQTLARQVDQMVATGQMPDQATAESYENAVRDLEMSPVGQAYVVARSNFEKLMAKVNQQISEGMEKGATSSIITLG